MKAQSFPWVQISRLDSSVVLLLYKSHSHIFSFGFLKIEQESEDTCEVFWVWHPATSLPRVSKSVYSGLNHTKLSKIFEQLTFVELRECIQLLINTTLWGKLYPFAWNTSYREIEIFVSLFTDFILSMKNKAWYMVRVQLAWNYLGATTSESVSRATKLASAWKSGQLAISIQLSMGIG